MRVKRYGLQKGVTDPATEAQILKAIKDMVNEAERKIISGEIKVPIGQY